MARERPAKYLARRLLYYGGLNRLLLALRSRSIILGYHRVIPAGPGLLNQFLDSVSPEDFAGHLRYLRSLGFRFVGLNELVASLSPAAGRPARLAVVTFDDGYRDLYDNALPILRDLGVPFSLFLNTATVGANRLSWVHRVLAALDRVSPETQTRLLAAAIQAPAGLGLEELFGRLVRWPDSGRLEAISQDLASRTGLTPEDEARTCRELYLDWGQLSELAGQGGSIECHTHEHFPLSSLGGEQVAGQIQTCNQIIQQNLGRPPQAMSIPFGLDNAGALPRLSQLRLSAVCTSRRALVGPDAQAEALPRVFPVGNTLDLATRLSRLLLGNKRNKTGRG
ncbi:MAG: polysaccharide deacetylase family protein [Thermodesulfobacteriota bacterium]